MSKLSRSYNFHFHLKIFILIYPLSSFILLVVLSHIENGSIPTSYQEADLVVPRKLQQFSSSENDSIAHEKEERRVLYVAMTRAKNQLFLTFHTDKTTTRSKFLNDIDIKPQTSD